MIVHVVYYTSATTVMMPLTFIQGWIPVFITVGFHPMGSMVVYTSEKH